MLSTVICQLFFFIYVKRGFNGTLSLYKEPRKIFSSKNGNQKQMVLVKTLALQDEPFWNLISKSVKATLSGLFCPPQNVRYAECFTNTLQTITQEHYLYCLAY